MGRLLKYKKLNKNNLNNMNKLDEKSLKDNKLFTKKEQKLNSSKSNSKEYKKFGETFQKIPTSILAKGIKTVRETVIKHKNVYKRKTTDIFSSYIHPCARNKVKRKLAKKNNTTILLNKISYCCFRSKYSKITNKKNNPNRKTIVKEGILDGSSSSNKIGKKSLSTKAGGKPSRKITTTITTTPSTIIKKVQKSKSKIYGFMKQFLKKTFLKHQQYLQKNDNEINEDTSYVELPQQNLPVINNDFKDANNINLENCSNKDNLTNKNNVMQDIRIRFEHQQGRHSRNSSPASTPRTPRRPIHLFTPSTLNINDNDNSINANILRSPSSEEDNSPTEMNNCRKIIDKPPLVKRLTMGLFRPCEDSRPLVHNTTNNHTLNLNNCGSTNTISDGYVNEGICEPEKFISSKFGDSCRQSLTAISTLESHSYLDNSEFNFKKKYIRETMSANSSPKIFAPHLLKNKGGLSPLEQHELKGAAWFQAGISREIAVEILSSQSPGSFLVRQSNTKADCFVLSVRVPPPAPKVAHYLILRTIRGYKIKGFTKEFTSLRALITHHSVMPELLPVPLALPRPVNVTPRRRNVDDFESYGSLRLLGILNMLQSHHNDNNHNNHNNS